MHADGGQIAVHCQTTVGYRDAVLAGADSQPCGGVAGEISWLIKAGMPVEAAVGAGSWTARAWLGLPRHVLRGNVIT